MTTYRMIVDRVRESSGFTPKTCWVAHVKADCGLTARVAHNRRCPRSRVHRCPYDKRAAIVAAMRHFGLI